MAYPYRHEKETPVLSKYFGDPAARTVDGWRERGGVTNAAAGRVTNGVTGGAWARALGVTREHLSRSFATAGAPNLKRIIDLVQSGETLRANGLVEVAEIMKSTARLIVNRASLKTEYAAINELMAQIKGALAPCR